MEESDQVSNNPMGSKRICEESHEINRKSFTNLMKSVENPIESHEMQGGSLKNRQKREIPQNPNEILHKSHKIPRNVRKSRKILQESQKTQEIRRLQ